MAPFLITGKTLAFTGATTAPTAVQPVTYNNVPPQQLMISNVGAVTVFICMSSSASADAIAKGVVPTGTAQDCFPVLAGTQVVVSNAANGIFVTGVTGSSTAVVYVTPGVGA